MDQEKRPQVYVGMAADIVHHGHVNILKCAMELGEVTVGLLTNEAIQSYKRVPIVSFENRKLLMEHMKGVEHVIPQTTLDYRLNLITLKPDFVVHGSDWKKGKQTTIRLEVIETLAAWGGKLVEPEYTSGISTSEIIERMKESKKESKSD